MIVRTTIPSIYLEPTQEDTCIVIAYFNPLNSRTKEKNANHIIKMLLDSKIPIFVIELLLPYQKSGLFFSTKTVHSKSIYFAKENLFNIAEQYLDYKYTKIIFLDADIKFSNSNWFNESSILLDAYDVIQPMSYVFKNLPKQHKKSIDVEFKSDYFLIQQSVAYSIVHTKSADRKKHHPGYAIGIKRELFNNINGFYELALLGGGDCVFWSNIIDYDIQDIIRHFDTSIYNVFLAYHKNAQKYLNPNKIGYIKNCLALHLQHGSILNRNYQNRYEIFKNHSGINFWHNNDSALELDFQTQKLIKSYFISRKE